MGHGAFPGRMPQWLRWGDHRLPDPTRYRGGTVPDLHRIPSCFHRLRWNQRAQTTEPCARRQTAPVGPRPEGVEDKARPA